MAAKSIWPWVAGIGAVVAAVVGGVVVWKRRQDQQASQSASTMATFSRSTAPGPTMATFSPATWPGGKFTVTVHLPTATIDWNKDAWSGSRLESLFQRGQKLSFEKAVAITKERHKSTDAGIGGGCWEVVDTRWIHLFPYEVVVVPASLWSAIGKLDLRFGHAPAVAMLRSGAVASKKLATDTDHSSWYSGNNKIVESVQMSFNLPAGQYYVVAIPHVPKTNHWCAPMGWWEWTNNGPWFKSYHYMKNHCTSHMTKFDRSVYYQSLLEISVPVVSADLHLRPNAHIWVGERNHWEPSYGNTFYALCKARKILQVFISNLAKAAGQPQVAYVVKKM